MTLECPFNFDHLKVGYTNTGREVKRVFPIELTYSFTFISPLKTPSRAWTYCYARREGGAQTKMGTSQKTIGAAMKGLPLAKEPRHQNK